MSKSNAFETELLAHIFNDVAIAALTGVTTLYVSLHTADPDEAGDQATNEVTYPAYARVAVTRDNTGWTVAGNVVNPAAEIPFPERTDAGASETATHWGVGVADTGPGTLLYSGPITTPASGILIGENVTPRLTPATSITED